MNMSTSIDIEGEALQVFTSNFNEDVKTNLNKFKIAGFFKQFGILSWKNFILSKRSIKGLITEITVPLLLIIILMIMRIVVNIDYKNELNPNSSSVLSNYVTLNRKLVLYYPNNSFIESIVKRGIDFMKMKNQYFDPIIMGANFSRISNIEKNDTTLNTLLAFYSFPSTYENDLPNNVQYNLYTQEGNGGNYKVSSSLVEKNVYMYESSPESLCHSKNNFLIYNLFNALKYSVDLSLIEKLTNVEVTDPDIIKLAQLPCQAYVDDNLKQLFSFFVTIILQIAFIFTFITNLNNIIIEKESKMKEYLKIVGIKWYTIWFTWFIRIFLMYFILSLIFSIISVIQFSTDNLDSFKNYITKALFKSTDFIVIFATVIVYSIQSASFIVLAAQFFKKPFLAKMIGVVFWIVTAINFYSSISTESLKYFFAILPNTGLLFCFQIIFQYERSSKTLNFSSLYQNLFGEPINLGLILTCMMSYSILFFIISWYIEHVMPGEYGVALPLYFPFMPSYWLKNKKTEIKSTKSEKSKKSQTAIFEKEDFKAKPTIQLKDISKDFMTGFKKKRVVDNVSVNFYENQVTGLLGHNGAGKTTLTFMLSGIYPPSGGTAIILGYDIVRDMSEVRSSLGFCPQHDILYDQLNVEEHLKIIALIKGFPKEQIQSELIRISTFVGLQNDLKTLSKDLSGGMKRRLSVAMALVGDSKIIILDEPTSGLDPFNRRGLWELIRKYKENRTIILTTHFMEEADALSDRIIILNHGEVKCCGSPIFLKNSYGSGYNLTVSKADNFIENEFLKTVLYFVSNYKVETNVAGEIKISLPYSSVDKLPDLLNKLDKNKINLGIASYGISSSTIEEIFLKIGGIDKDGNLLSEDGDESNDTNSPKDPSNGLATVFNKESNVKTGFKLWLQQIKGLMIKRLILLKARYALGFITLVLPIIAEAFICYLIPIEDDVIDSIRQAVRPSGNYTFNIENYKTYTMPYAITGNIDQSTFSNVFEKFYSKSNRPTVELLSLKNDTISSFVLEKRKSNLINLVRNYYTGFSFDVINSTTFTAIGYYSTLAYHSSATILNEITNLLLAFYNSNNLNNKTITTTNSPVPKPDSFFTSALFYQTLSCIDFPPLSLLNFLTSIVIAVFISFFVAHVGKERINGSKRLQLLSGVHYSTYWIGNFIFDFIICLYTICGLIGVIKLIDYIRDEPLSETYSITNNGNLGYFFVLLLFSSFGWLMYGYVMSHFFKTEIVGFIVLLIVLGLAAFIDIIWASLQLFISLDVKDENLKESLNKFMEAIRWLIVILFPNVTIKRGLFNMKVRTNEFCIDAVNNFFKYNFSYNEPALGIEEPGLGSLILISILQFIIGAGILFLLERKLNLKKICCKNSVHAKFESNTLEDDVSQEFNRIKNADIKSLSNKESLVVNDILMKFKKKGQDFIAVNHLSFGVQKKECFGLLGLNGAGKTSTFRILTGEIDATSGTAYINGLNINENRFSARRNLGFCPQYDFLPEFLTVEETLTLFARLRGLETDIIEETVNEMINVFKLNEFTKKYVQNLSGGNKRKVNASIAFLGKPSVVILDEPTTGMDPAARRYLWTVINKARDLGMTIVLTSHTMEECEALCTRLGIMVNGQFQCLGNIQHLKNKYGKGYALVVKCRTSDNDTIIKTVDNFLKNNISSIKLKDQQENTLFYEISWDNNNSTKEKSLSNLFSIVEKNKNLLKIETYSISQTTLEDVFLSFASLQKTEDTKDSKYIKV